MSIELPDIESYILLLLVKNLDEGEGASLPMIDHSFFRIMHEKDIHTELNNLELLEKVNSLCDKRELVINKKGNYTITDSGKQKVLISSKYKEVLFRGK